MAQEQSLDSTSSASPGPGLACYASRMSSRGRNPIASPSAGGHLEVPDPFELLTTAAIREMLARPDVDSFLEWMRREGPKGHPGVFADLPDPEFWPSFATTLGIGLWNAMPLPNNRFRAKPLPEQKGSAPCRCRSGKKYARCCARLPGPPSFPATMHWIVMIREMEDATLNSAAASLQMPADLLLELVQHWRSLQLYERILKLLEPVFRKLPKILADQPHRDQQDKPIREFLVPLLEIFVDALMEEGSAAKQRRWRKRLLEELPEELHRSVTVLGI